MTSFFQIDPAPNRETVRLFCIPHSGGGASAFRGWKEQLEPDIEVILVKLPGRESRYREKPYHDMEILICELTEAMLPYVDDGQKFALFGNSLGGLIAFETLHRIERSTGLRAVQLFVSAVGAPHLSPPLPPISHLDDGELIREVSSRYGGIPDLILQDRDFLAAVVSCLRADLHILETYKRRPPDPLSSPITAFGGTRDWTIPVDHIGRWGEQTSTSFNRVLLDQEHLYLQSAKDKLTAHIRETLSADACAL
jgi:medium-chain acyl-[acyl-carrier-protein] hydrolase